MQRILFTLLMTTILAAPVFAAEPAKTVTKAEVVQEKTIHVGVNGMVCDFCAQSLKKTFKKQGAVKDVQISLEKKMVTLTMKPGQKLADAMIRKLITNAGYAVTTIHRM